jgi:ABC-type multidrug transport system fused ATPase/permease subunit
MRTQNQIEGKLRPSLKGQFLSILGIFNRTDRLKLAIVAALQIFLSLLDLLGVAIIGLLGALSINGVQSRMPGDRISQFLKMVGLYDNAFQVQAAALGLAAGTILILRTVTSIFITKKVLFYLSRRGAVISSDLIKKLMAMPLVKIQEKTLYENLYALTTGVSNVTLGVIGAGVIIVSDLALLAIMSIGLFYVDPKMAISTILFFAIIGYLLFKKMHVRAEKLGQLEADLNIQSNERITEVLSSYRESVVRNRRHYYATEIGQNRLQIANVLAELSFMPNISKYVLESSVILGALAISAFQFLTQDAAHAVATLAIFLAAGTRIAPAVLRVQQGTIQIKRSLGASSITLQIVDKLKNLPSVEAGGLDLDVEHSGFYASVKLSDVSFKYPGANSQAVKKVNLELFPGQKCAVVGPSGAGKSTLIDLILGVIEPDEGVVQISGTSALDAIRKWPGALGYVPQDVVIWNGTIRSNIGLGFPEELVLDNLVSDAIQNSLLSTYVDALQLKALSKVGDRGSSMSGGQRQRLGIARAFYTKPKLLVLDEATSSLDGETEASIVKSINELDEDITVILIAHRLSSIRDADQVVYLEDGEIKAVGTFDEVRKMVSNFDHQASLMGL